MEIYDLWVRILERQGAAVRSAVLDLEDSERAEWRVVQARMAVISETRAYVRLLEDAPSAVLIAHMIKPECST